MLKLQQTENIEILGACTNSMKSAFINELTSKKFVIQQQRKMHSLRCCTESVKHE